MALPLYKGVAIFGLAPIVNVQSTNPAARQEIAFPGLNGVASVPLGTRGRYIQASGRLIGVSPGDLAANDTYWHALVNGLPGPLVTTLGQLWPYCILEAFDPEPRVRQGSIADWLGGSINWYYHHRYTARFRSLT